MVNTGGPNRDMQERTMALRAEALVSRRTCDRNDSGSSGPSSPRGRLLPVLIATGVLAGLFGAFVLSASRLWLQPDSTAYITLAVGIAERLDFSHELYQLRTPGYPLLLAGVFRLFGAASPTAILLLQHAMVVGIALLSVMIAWTLWPRRSLALIVGLFSAFSLHLSGYANSVMTEVPYAFAMTACVYLLVRYYTHGGSGPLVGAAILAATAALIRPMGLPIVLIVAAAAVVRSWQEAKPSTSRSAGDQVRQVPGRARLGPVCRALLLTIGPSSIVLLPMMLHNYNTHGYFKLTCMGGITVYKRALCVERLDSGRSESLTRVRNAVDTARERGWIGPEATYRNLWPTVQACERVYDASFCDAAELMNRAGRDVMLEDPWLIASRAVVYSYRTLVMPDWAYRVQPGGTPGVNDRLAKGATLYAVDTFTPIVSQRVGLPIMARYLPMTKEPTNTTAWWTEFTRWYHHRIERGTPVTGLLDTPYEEFTALAVLGAALAMGLRRRGGWLLLGAVIVYQIAIGSFLGGAQPRFTVPLDPLLHVLAALPVALAGEAVTFALTTLRHRLRAEALPRESRRAADSRR